ncbi:MAG: FAD-dependent oxidoreductase, partial [Gammaproteobacteria bacterium]|nr:FAD-dependent oxidoreductase [Gammaproteobacteria bacterium]
RRPSRASDLFAFKANFGESELAPGLLPVLAFAGGYGGMVIADNAKLTLACCIRRDIQQQCRACMPGTRAGEAVQAYLEESCLGVRQALRGARREGAWLSVGPIRPGIRSPWRGEGAFSIGNAAGEAHPILGEGISMAIQSAWLLCERLIAHRQQLMAGRAQSLVGRDYAQSWHKSFAPRIRMAAVLAHLAMRPSAAGVLLPLLHRCPRILTTSARLGGKVRRIMEA